jgi:uncharacterized protein YjbI with pentapeptide repeats
MRNSSVPQCKYYYECCRRDVEDNSAEGLCILHSTDSAKDIRAFANALATHRERNGENFANFVFPGETDFRGVTFIATFTEGADFIGATFTQEAGFRGATFTKEAVFIGATFNELVSFLRATFAQGANFNSATFKTAEFLEAMFTEVSFFRTTFTKRDTRMRTFVQRLKRLWHTPVEFYGVDCPEPQAGSWHDLLLFVLLLVVLGLLWLVRYLPERTVLVHGHPPAPPSHVAQAARLSGELTPGYPRE